MKTDQKTFVILSKNSGSLFSHAGVLNGLGYYTIYLCEHVREVLDLLTKGKRFEYLVYDGYDLKKDAHHLQMIASHNAILSIITVSEANFLQRKNMFLWAKTHKIPLRGVLQMPLRSNELDKLVGTHHSQHLVARPKNPA